MRSFSLEYQLDSVNLDRVDPSELNFDAQAAFEGTSLDLSNLHCLSLYYDPRSPVYVGPGMTFTQENLWGDGADIKDSSWMRWVFQSSLDKFSVGTTDVAYCPNTEVVMPAEVFVESDTFRFPNWTTVFGFPPLNQEHDELIQVFVSDLTTNRVGLITYEQIDPMTGEPFVQAFIKFQKESQCLS